MLTYTNVIAGRSRPTSYGPTEAVLQGGSSESYTFVWSPSARVNQSTSGNNAGPEDMATRTRSTCFIRGLKENAEVQVTNGLPWQWRRIVIAGKGIAQTLDPGGNQYISNLTSNGYVRTVNEVVPGLNKIGLYNGLFQGFAGTDWDDDLVAKTDNARSTVLYDRVRTISSGNEQGTIRKYKFWHPINKNLVYDDDEQGGDTAESRFSTLSRAGCGDIIVIDIIKPRGGSSTTDRMTLRFNSTWYWHEK